MLIDSAIPAHHRLRNLYLAVYEMTDFTVTTFGSAENLIECYQQQRNESLYTGAICSAKAYLTYRDAKRSQNAESKDREKNQSTDQDEPDPSLPWYPLLKITVYAGMALWKFFQAGREDARVEEWKKSKLRLLQLARTVI